MKQTICSVRFSNATQIKVIKMSLDCLNTRQNENNNHQRKLIRLKRKDVQTFAYPNIMPAQRNTSCQTEDYFQHEESKLNDSLFHDYLDSVDLTSANSNIEPILANTNYISNPSSNNTESLLPSIAFTKKSQYSKSNHFALSNLTLQKAINTHLKYNNSISPITQIDNQPYDNLTLQKAINTHLKYNNSISPITQIDNQPYERLITIPSLTKPKMIKEKAFPLAKLYSNNKHLMQIKQLFREAIYINNRMLCNNQLKN